MTEEKTKAEIVEDQISFLISELKLAHEDKYDQDKAERTAAGFLAAQADLAYFISSIELHSRQMKRELERVVAETYFEIKQNISGKVTEAAIQQNVNKHENVLEAKENYNKAEADSKKWNLMFGILKDGHIFFRNIGKGKNEWG